MLPQPGPAPPKMNIVVELATKQSWLYVWRV